MLQLHLHPLKLTWIPKTAIFERRYILKTIILGIYVKFPGATNHRFFGANQPSFPTTLSPVDVVLTWCGNDIEAARALVFQKFQLGIFWGMWC